MATKKINPPKWPARILEWYCGADLAEDLLGDVDEIYFANLKKMSVFKARWKYWLQTLTLLFSYAVRSRKRNRVNRSGNPYSLAMFNNYSKIAIRSLGRQKTFSVINAICLSTGMSVGLLALSAFIDMKEVDDFQIKSNRIYRVISKVDDGNNKLSYASSSSPLAHQLLQEGAGIESVVQFNRDFDPEFVKGGNTSIPLSGYYVSPDFFTMFSFSLLEGNPATALTKPFSLVITKASAKKLFGNEKALGKVIEVKGFGDFEVTGVLNDYHRSHLLFDVLTSFSTISALENKGILNDTGLQDWGPRTNYYTYVLFQEGKQPSELDFLLNQIADEQNKKVDATAKVAYSFQNLNAIPGSDHYNEIGLVWGYLTMGVFFALSLLVLLPACFNYTNISIARALKRAKEIGLRKVSGGESKNIFIQMVLETVILAVLSLLGAILIFIAIRTEFMKMIVEGSRSFDFEISTLTFFAFLFFAIGVGIVAGIFPALYFSKLNPIETLRNSSLSGKLSKVNVRKGLIVFQFALSLVFILGVGIIVKQYQYALNFDYGFQKENILEIPINGANAEVLITELSRHSEITEVAISSSIPGSWQSSAAWVKRSEQDDSLQVYQMFIDEQYLNCLELKLLTGTNFTNSQSQNEEYIIVNEEFLNKFQITTPTEALDRAFIVDGNKTLRILGVVKNFNHMPLQEQISSFFFRYDPTKMAFIHAKIASNDITSTLASIEQTWNMVVPDQKLEATFLDAELEESLISFRSMMKIFGFLGAIAITISCLGLLAVAISTSESRLKEMGIRKIMGASVSNLALTLSKGFIKLILIAIVITTPLTYLFFDQLFLRVHHFRTTIGLIEIGGSILFLLVLVAVTIGSQTLRVANVNPVDTLKNE